MDDGGFWLSKVQFLLSKPKLVMLSIEQTKVLLQAHHAFIDTNSAELIELINLVEKTIPNEGSPERKEWISHMGCLCDVWQHHTIEGKKLPGLMYV